MYYRKVKSSFFIEFQKGGNFNSSYEVQFDETQLCFGTPTLRHTYTGRVGNVKWYLGGAPCCGDVQKLT